MNSRPVSSNTWSYVISIGLGYLNIHVVSTKFAIDIAILSSYWVILNHTITGNIMVMAFRFKFSIFDFIIMP